MYIWDLNAISNFNLYTYKFSDWKIEQKPYSIRFFFCVVANNGEPVAL